MQNIKYKLAIFLAGVFALFLSSCGGIPTGNTSSNTANPQTVGRPGGSLVYRVTSPVKTLNYYMADDEPAVVATLFLMNDTLVEMDHASQKYVPALAETYQTAADGVTVDVTLREGLKFSDGQPLTTSDVEFSLKGAYDKRTGSRIFRDALLINGQEMQTKIIDKRKMQFILPEKVAAVENYLENLAVLPKHALNADFEAGKLGEAWQINADPKIIISSGPFMVDSVQTGERVTLKRDPNYWKKDSAGNQLPYLDAIVLEIVSEANNTFARLRQGTIDVADRIRTSDFAALKTTTESAVKPHDAGPSLGTDHIWFNLNTAKMGGDSLEATPKYKWFSDKRFRRAVSHAIDRQTISNTTLQGLATPIFGFVPAGNRAWLNANLPKTEYDLEKALGILKEAGFAQKDAGGKAELFDGAGNRVEFTMIVPAENEPRKLMAAVIQEDLAKLGMNVTVAPVDFQGLTERWTTSFDYDAILLGSSLTATDPSGFAGFLTSSGGVHQWRPKQVKPATEWEAKIDQLFARQAQETDPAARKKTFDEIQTIIAEEMPIVPIVSRHIVSAANAKVGNIATSSVLPYSLWNAEWLYVQQ